MRILHYALGFYPYRTGGLTTYVMDVMQEQKKQGHQVGMLWPGRMGFFPGHAPSIKRNKECIAGQYVDGFEMIHPLPVPLLEGIRDIDAYQAGCDRRIFIKFLKEYAPQMIHVHTFMGLYREMLEAAKELNIPIVFTTHDYFPLCPKVNLICNNKECESGMTDEGCSACNQRALSKRKIWLMQSVIYRKLKNTKLLRGMRKQYQIERQEDQETGAAAKEILPYTQLLKYYKSMLQLMDCILCNSDNTQELYRKLGQVSRTILLPITNAHVQDKRHRAFAEDKEKVRLTYLGAATQAKGFYLLKEVLDELWETGERNFCLNVYTAIAEKREYLNVYAPYQGEAEMDQVYQTTDVLLVPSVWRETFGFVVAEALSQGTPVIVSDLVGAKNLIRPGINGYCIPAEHTVWADCLRDVLHHREILRNMRKNIQSETFQLSIEEHVRKLQGIYENINHYCNI